MLYITEMLRWGSQETHHYIVGIYSTYELAKTAGEVEKSWRGGTKYEYQIIEKTLDDILDPEKVDHHNSCLGVEE